eukprot:Partr_v1_DN26279_c2_g1_i2_m48475 putative NA
MLRMFDTKEDIVPASPCDRELENDKSKTAFLIAGYVRYERPYVWIRSHHYRLLRKVDGEPISPGLDQPPSLDDPMKLQSVKDWKEKDIRVWDIVDEVLQVSAGTPLANPFAINHDYYNLNSLPVSVIQTGAMISFLKRLLSNGNCKYKDQI